MLNYTANFKFCVQSIEPELRHGTIISHTVLYASANGTSRGSVTVSMSESEFSAEIPDLRHTATYMVEVVASTAVGDSPPGKLVLPSQDQCEFTMPPTCFHTPKLYFLNGKIIFDNLKRISFH